MLWATLGSKDGFHQLVFRYEREWDSLYVPVDDKRRFLRLARRLRAEAASLSVSGAPRATEHPYPSTAGSALWARVASGNANDLLVNFRPRPTLLLRQDDIRATGIWALDRPLHFIWLERANRRLAHHLGTTKKWGHPEQGLIPLDFKRAEITPALYEPRRVVGGLRDAPEPFDWREAKG